MSIALLFTPPDYFKKIVSQEALAWNCGENGEYFQKLFKQPKEFIHKTSEMYFVVLENGETKRVENMARKSGFLFYKSP